MPGRNAAARDESAAGYRGNETMLKGFNWIGALVALVLMEALGFLWYGPLFGDMWMKALGRTPDMSNATLNMVLGAVVTVIIIVGIDWLLRRLGALSLMPALMASFAAWFFFNFTTMAVDYLYVGLSATRVAINMGYQLVAYLIAGACIALIRRRSA
jgi:hypothetical protein